MYLKTEPNIKFTDFYDLLKTVKHFKSLRGKDYHVVDIDDDEMIFIRESTNKKWNMSLKGVHLAYVKLDDFKTENFRNYVERTHSPALGLLLHLGLLKRSI